MLELKNIKKDYSTGDEKVEALKGINLKFRESEFVSILGQSGCGKTTLLNIIGGLDRYTSGDLVINGKSTRDFKDRDWDAYRNYSVGFIFQSYNLIGHQSILSNVELALTISGVSKKERRKKAIKALEDVGLKEQIHKKPNQLSGGQMQRVAIARALVNDPDIILADEPTGALDTKTSKQVMEILKQISKDKLIIMVTHNPELAEEYSNRIIKILDGKILDDSNPVKEEEKGKKEAKKYGATSMKRLVALRLSLNNLMTKKARTILTSFAGSIGIIGIALILAISTGIQNYIDKVEEDTLSSYPLTIEAESVDMSTVITAMMGTSGEVKEEEKEEGRIYSRNIMTDLMSTISSQVTTNNLEDFKRYLENDDTVIKENSNSIQYGYDLTLNLYAENTADGVVQVNPSNIMNILGLTSGMSSYSNTSMGFSSTDVWTELLDNPELIKSQYKLLAGKWAEDYNEVVLMVDEDGYVSDYTLYTLGILSQDELEKEYKKMLNGDEFAEKEHVSLGYEEILGLKYKLILNPDYYKKENGIWIDKTDDEEYMKNIVDEAEEIKVVGIIQADKEGVASSSYGEIGYLSSLKEYVINKIDEADIVKEQKENTSINIFTGSEFPSEDDDSTKTFDLATMSNEEKIYYSSLSSDELAQIMLAYQENADSTYEENLKKLGVIDIDSPTSISIYPSNFDSKEIITDEIEKYNIKMEDDGKEENVITYNDVVGTMMSSVSTIVNLISDVLIAFVSISLIVSSIMIGIITYISVLERTKEIGILRAMGASKKDISRVFKAEAFIIGLIAGLIGIGITILLTIPINSVIFAISGVELKTTVPFIAGVVLVILSVILTSIGGLIPAKIASKKDPVIALRTE
jgi:putative ABC transport system permease protein